MEIHAHPAGYEVEVASLGGLPGALRAEDYRFKSGFALLRKSDDQSAEWDSKVGVIGGIIHRYLQRGAAALATPDLEVAACNAAGIGDRLKRHGPDSEEYGYQKLNDEHVSPELLRRAVAAGFATESAQPEIDPSLRQTLLTNEAERLFLGEACGAICANLGRHLLPKVAIGDLGAGAPESRPVDFVYSDGVSEPTLIQIDGIENDDDTAEFEKRRKLLAAQGLPVKQISAEYLLDSLSRSSATIDLLDQVREPVSTKESQDGLEEWAKATRWIQEGAAVQAALTLLWINGNIGDGEFDVLVTGRMPREVWTAAVEDWSALAKAVIDAHGLTGSVKRPQPKIAENDAESTDRNQVLIALETEYPWWHKVSDERPDIAVRRCVPVTEAWLSAAVDPEWDQRKNEINGASEATRNSGLEWLLRAAFRKRRFREAQASAIKRWVDKKDTVVLLPTGAGKSLIYQLTALISPGTTLLIAPLVALINDQREGLEQFGIRRMEGLSRDGSTREDENRAIEDVERGSLIFLAIAPERLQKPVWRLALGVASNAGGIAGAVIDEGHCVSEWGHDFRPAYGQLGNALRERLNVAAILVLTGTASRSVYRDMVAHIELDRDDPEACIRPSTHDRPEIRMSLSYCTTPRDAEVARKSAIKSILRQFPGNPKNVFRPRGSNTLCGIMFMPTATGWRNGIEAGVKLVQQAGLGRPVTYAGQEPYSEWRIEHARLFKRNQASVMVATSGYGMGVDKPNVRWVIHPHLTGSLESYYQQIGRSGRDREKAYSIAVIYDQDPENTDKVLDASRSFSEAKEVYEDRGSRYDDIGTAMYFHFGQYNGVESETKSILKTVDLLHRSQPLDTPGSREINYPREDAEQKALERDIVRLIRLRIAEYYEVNYGAKKMVVHVRKWTEVDVREGLAEYVGRFDRARAVAMKDELETLLESCGGDLLQIVQAGCRTLVDYLYETVEPARRRALHETVLMARTCSEDSQIRERMLDYLSEGKGSEKIDRLLKEARLDWDEWHSLFGDVANEGQMEAGRLRGLFIRSLESNPGNPALLLGRAISECACKDAELGVVIENMRAAIEALPRYSRENQLDQAVDGMCEWIAQAEDDGFGPLCALADLSANQEMSGAQKARVKSRAKLWADRAYMPELTWMKRSAAILKKAEQLGPIVWDIGK